MKTPRAARPRAIGQGRPVSGVTALLSSPAQAEPHRSQASTGSACTLGRSQDHGQQAEGAVDATEAIQSRREPVAATSRSSALRRRSSWRHPLLDPRYRVELGNPAPEVVARAEAW